MRDGQLHIERVTNEEKGFEVMRLAGPLTLATLFQWQENLRNGVRRKTIIDLSGVPYIDSAGLGALLSFHGSCKRTGCLYSLAAMPARVYTMFAASKVDNLVHISRTFEEAEAFLAQ